MEYKVLVKQEYIDDFIKRDRAIPCPIQMAIVNQTNLGADVFKEWINFYSNEFGFKSYKIEYKRALEFIQRADSGKSIKPFEFIFNV